MSGRAGSISNASISGASVSSLASLTAEPRMRVTALNQHSDLSPQSSSHALPAKNAMPRYVVHPFFSKNTIELQGPIMFGYINGKNELNQPLNPPLREDIIRGLVGQLRVTADVQQALPWLHTARNQLIAEQPQLDINQSQLKQHENYDGLHLTSEDILFLCHAERLAKLKDTQLLGLCNSIKRSLEGWNKTKNKTKREACISLVKYLLATVLREPIRSPSLMDAREMAKKWVEGENLTPDIYQKFAINGILGLTENEILGLPLDTLHHILIRDNATSVLHLNKKQMVAFVNAVAIAQENQKQHPDPAHEKKVNLLSEFVKQTIGPSVPLSARDFLEDYVTRGETTQSLMGLRAVRDVMRAARALDLSSTKAKQMSSLRPEEIALFGAHDLMALNIEDINLLDHKQTLALSLVMRETWNTVKDRADLTRLLSVFHAATNVLSDRVFGLMSFVHDPEVKLYSSSAKQLLDEINSNRPQTEVKSKFIPLNIPTYPDQVKISSQQFIQRSFSELTEADIQLLDLNEVLNLSQHEQMKWFVAIDELAIINSDEPIKIWYWIQAMRYLHYKSDSPRLHLAIEKQISLLRHTWLTRIERENPNLAVDLNEYRDILDSFFALAFIRQQIGINGLLNPQHLSQTRIENLTLTELLRCDLNQYPSLSEAKVKAFVKAAAREININRKSLIDTDSSAFSLYKRLNWMYYQQVLSQASLVEGIRLNPDVINALEEVLKDCIDAMSNISPLNLEQDQGVTIPPFSSGISFSTASVEPGRLEPQAQKIAKTPSSASQEHFNQAVANLKEYTGQTHYKWRKFSKISLEEIRDEVQLINELARIQFDQTTKVANWQEKLLLILQELKRYELTNGKIAERVASILANIDFHFIKTGMIDAESESIWKKDFISLYSELIQLNSHILSQAQRAENPDAVSREKIMADSAKLSQLDLNAMELRLPALKSMGYLKSNYERTVFIRHLERLVQLTPQASGAQRQSIRRLIVNAFVNYAELGMLTDKASGFVDDLLLNLQALIISVEHSYLNKAFIQPLAPLSSVESAKSFLQSLEDLTKAASLMVFPKSFFIDLTSVVRGIQTHYVEGELGGIFIDTNWKSKAAEYCKTLQELGAPFYLASQPSSSEFAFYEENRFPSPPLIPSTSDPAATIGSVKSLLGLTATTRSFSVFSQLSEKNISEDLSDAKSLSGVIFDKPTKDLDQHWQQKLLLILKNIPVNDIESTNYELEDFEKLYNLLIRIRTQFITSELIDIDSPHDDMDKEIIHLFIAASTFVVNKMSNLQALRESNALTKSELIADATPLFQLELADMMLRLPALRNMGYLANQEQQNSLLLHLNRLTELAVSADSQQKNLITLLLRRLYENYIELETQPQDTLENRNFIKSLTVALYNLAKILQEKPSGSVVESEKYPIPQPKRESPKRKKRTNKQDFSELVLKIDPRTGALIDAPLENLFSLEFKVKIKNERQKEQLQALIITLNNELSQLILNRPQEVEKIENISNLSQRISFAVNNGVIEKEQSRWFFKKIAFTRWLKKLNHSMFELNQRLMNLGFSRTDLSDEVIGFPSSANREVFTPPLQSEFLAQRKEDIFSLSKQELIQRIPILWRLGYINELERRVLEIYIERLLKLMETEDFSKRELQIISSFQASLSQNYIQFDMLDPSASLEAKTSLLIYLNALEVATLKSMISLEYIDNASPLTEEQFNYLGEYLQSMVRVWSERSIAVELLPKLDTFVNQIEQKYLLHVSVEKQPWKDSMSSLLATLKDQGLHTKITPFYISRHSIENLPNSELFKQIQFDIAHLDDHNARDRVTSFLARAIEVSPELGDSETKNLLNNLIYTARTNLKVDWQRKGVDLTWLNNYSYQLDSAALLISCSHLFDVAALVENESITEDIVAELFNTEFNLISKICSGLKRRAKITAIDAEVLPKIDHLLQYLYEEYYLNDAFSARYPELQGNVLTFLTSLDPTIIAYPYQWGIAQGFLKDRGEGSFSLPKVASKAASLSDPLFSLDVNDIETSDTDSDDS